MEMESGLRVCTDFPHLVSLGSGRLSTAVTLLPLKEGQYHHIIIVIMMNTTTNVTITHTHTHTHMNTYTCTVYRNMI